MKWISNETEWGTNCCYLCVLPMRKEKIRIETLNLETTSIWIKSGNAKKELLGGQRGRRMYIKFNAL